MDPRSIRRAAIPFAAVGWLAATALAGVATAGEAPPAPPAASANAPGSSPVYREFVLGNPKAKVMVIEYASLTCPHCAHFDQEFYPVLKKDYIDTGKIKYVYRDYPLDQLALAAAMVARCAPDDKGMTLIDMLFRNQPAWETNDGITQLAGFAKKVGMSQADVDACLKNDDIFDGIKKTSTMQKVDGTPTFYVGKDMVDDASEVGFKKLREFIDKALAENTK